MWQKMCVVKTVNLDRNHYDYDLRSVSELKALNHSDSQGLQIFLLSLTLCAVNV